MCVCVCVCVCVQRSVPDVLNGLGAKAGELFIDVYQTTDY